MTRRQRWPEPLHDEAEAEQPAIEDWQKRYGQRADGVERIVMRVVILGLVGLVLVQTLQQNSWVRRQLNYTEAREGITWNQVAAWMSDRTGLGAVPASGEAQAMSLTVMLMSRRSAPEVKLLADDKVIGTFTGERVTARVLPGQVLRLDGTRASRGLTFRVVGATGLAAPALGLEVTTNGDTQVLGTVKATK